MFACVEQPGKEICKVGLLLIDGAAEDIK